MNINPSITRGLSRSLLKVSKHSPLILTAVGIAGLVTAGVMAARATLKLEDTVDEGSARLTETKDSVALGDADTSELTKVYIQNAADVAKLYWIPATLTVASAVLILSGHRILSQRNAALVVAYKGLETAFNNYRQRVVEQYGEEADQDIRYGVRHGEIENDKGKKVKTTEIDRVSTSEYLFDFGPSNPNWVGNFEHNMFFLTGHQNVFNDLLRARGHLFLSEVLDGLGIPRTPASIVTGWVYRPDAATGDNFVDLGIKDLWIEHGYILLDFNVDGVIYDQI